MNKLFTASDFAGSTEYIDQISWEDAADIANEKTESLMREAMKLREALDDVSFSEFSYLNDEINQVLASFDKYLEGCMK